MQDVFSSLYHMQKNCRGVQHKNLTVLVQLSFKGRVTERTKTLCRIIFFYLQMCQKRYADHKLSSESDAEHTQWSNRIHIQFTQQLLIDGNESDNDMS